MEPNGTTAVESVKRKRRTRVKTYMEKSRSKFEEFRFIGLVRTASEDAGGPKTYDPKLVVFGQILGIKVPVRKSDSYVDVSYIVARADTRGTYFTKYMLLPATSLYAGLLCKTLGLELRMGNKPTGEKCLVYGHSSANPDPLCNVIKTSMWIHPLLALHYFQWLYPKLALKVNQALIKNAFKECM